MLRTVLSETPRYPAACRIVMYQRRSIENGELNIGPPLLARIPLRGSKTQGQAGYSRVRKGQPRDLAVVNDANCRAATYSAGKPNPLGHKGVAKKFSP